MTVAVSQTVYDLIALQRDNAQANATAAATIITAETANQATWQDTADHLTNVLADLIVE